MAVEGRASCGPSGSPRGEGLLAVRLALGMAPAAAVVVGNGYTALNLGNESQGLLRRRLGRAPLELGGILGLRAPRSARCFRPHRDL